MTESLTLPEAERQIVESVGVLIFDQDKVLTVRNKAGTGLGEGVYGLPSGKKRIINAETDRERAILELKQETGLIAKEEHLKEFPGNYFEAVLPVNGDERKVSWRVFVCSEYEGEINIESTDEIASVEWISIDKLPLYHMGPNVLQVIHNGQQSLNQLS